MYLLILRSEEMLAVTVPAGREPLSLVDVILTASAKWSVCRASTQQNEELQQTQQEINSRYLHVSSVHPTIKGELNLDQKWQSDDLFYIIMNEIHHRFNQFWVIFEDIVIYFKNLLTFKCGQISQWYFNSVIYGGGCVCKQSQYVSKNGRFFTWLRLNTSVDHVERGRTSHSCPQLCEVWLSKA